jgi:hypothetical protein
MRPGKVVKGSITVVLIDGVVTAVGANDRGR